MNSKKIELSPEDAVTILKKFLPEKWTSIDPSTVSVTRIPEGYVNTVHIVQVIGDDTSRVIIRHSGGNQFSEALSEIFAERTKSDELFVMQEMSRRCLGPKLYGVFNGGVVMEYIDSHTLTPEEAKDRKITDDLAKCYAHIHQMELPFNRIEGLKMKGLADGIKENDLETLKQSKAVNEFLTLEQITSFLKFNWNEEYDWTLKLIEKANMKVNFCQNDSNLANILVRNHPQEGQFRVVPIDYEIGGYSMRGCDLARFIALSPVDVRDKKNIKMGDSSFARKEIEHFVKTYADEYNRSAPSHLRDEERDTFDYVLKETEVGIALIAMEACVGFTKQIKFFEGANAHFVLMLPYLSTLYLEKKQELIQLYPELK